MTHDFHKYCRAVTSRSGVAISNCCLHYTQAEVRSRTGFAREREGESEDCSNAKEDRTCVLAVYRSIIRRDVANPGHSWARHFLLSGSSSQEVEKKELIRWPEGSGFPECDD